MPARNELESPNDVIELVCACGDIYTLRRINSNLYEAECLGCNNEYLVVVKHLEDD